MKRLIEIFAEQKLFGDMLTIAIIGLGLFSLTTLRREVFPNVEFDVIEVETLFPGASAKEVEQLLTSPLEQKLKEVDGVKKMTSTSVENRSGIYLELDINSTDLEKAKSDVRDIVDKFTSEKPEGAERPTVKSLESKENPIIEVSVSGDLPPIELREVAKRLEREFERIKGIGGVDLFGTEDREIQVHAIPSQLSRYRLTLEELTQALKRQNLSVPGGTIEGTPDKPNQVAVRTSGQFKTVEDVANTVVRANEMGRPIRIRDVATVVESLAKTKVISRTDGVPSIRLTVRQKEKADVIDLVDALEARVKELQPTIPPGVKLTMVNDASEYVRRRLGVLFGNFTIGLGLVLLFLPIFLPFRFSVLVAIGEPFAFLGTVLAFQAMDQGLNLISVIGLILVSGILVDDGIVVVENVARLMKEKGLKPKEAAILGAQQVWVPVVASAMVTVMAFIPMATMTGIFGKFVRFIPLGVIVPIFISLFENFFIMPHHIGTWLRPSDFDMNQKRGVFGAIQRGVDNWWEGRVMPFYLSVSGWILNRRYLIVFIFLPLAVALSGFLAFKVMKVVLFPPDGVEIFMVRVDAPVGTGLAGTQELLKPVEREIHALPKNELKNTLTLVGIQAQEPNDPMTRRGTEFGQVVVYLTPENERTRTAQQIIDAMREKIGTPPGVAHLSFERINTGPPVGKPISVGVRGEEYSDIEPAIKELKAIVQRIKGASDVQDSYLLGKKEIYVDLDYAEAAAAGLDVGRVGSTVRAAYEGLVATTVRTLDEEIDVRVTLQPQERTSERALASLQIPNQQGYLIPLSAISNLTYSQDLAIRAHEDNQREIRVGAEVDTHQVSALEATNQIRQQLPELKKKFPKVTWHFGGEDHDTQESLASLGRAFIMAIIGIFLILVLTFRTFFQPLVVLITIPLGLISVILTFFFHGLPLSFLGMVGMVGLSGIIVNNAIVFVEFVNEARRDGMDRWMSLREAARRRAKPIFLTTITTSIGILPTAYGIGGMDKFVVPIALAMGWGVTVGSALALFVLPPALAILDDANAGVEKLWNRAKRVPQVPMDR